VEIALPDIFPDGVVIQYTGPVWQIHHQIGSGNPSGLGRRATKQWIWIQNDPNIPSK